MFVPLKGCRVVGVGGGGDYVFIPSKGLLGAIFVNVAMIFTRDPRLTHLYFYACALLG